MTARARTLLAGVLVATGLPVVGAFTAAPAHAQPPAAQPLLAEPLLAQPFLAPNKPDKPKKPSERPKPGDQGQKRDDSDKPKKKKPKPDKTAPAAPGLSASAGAGGSVTIAVSAEAGAQVVVRQSGGGVVARATATGGTQTFGVVRSTGTHSFTARATDKAGNTSRPSSTSVFADATPPSLTDLGVKPGKPADSRSRVSFTTSEGAAYRVLVDQQVVAEGNAGNGKVKRFLDVANGAHQVVVVAIDGVGNTTTGARSLDVQVSKLKVKAKLTSDATEETQVLRVRATPNATRGVVRVPGEKNQRFALRKGRADVDLRLPNGTYDGVVVALRDSQKRKGRLKLPELVVDTTPPKLSVGPDQAAADEGKLAVAVTAEQDTTIAWELLDGSGEVVESGEYTAEGGEELIEEDVPEGSYSLVVSSTDQYDRTTTDVGPTRIAPDPWPVALVALLVVGLLAVVVGLVLGAVVLVRRHRARLEALRRRLADALATRRERAREAAERRQRLGAHRAAEEQWLRRRDFLAGLLDDEELAAGPLLILPDLETLPHERVLHTTPAQLFETVGDNGGELALQSLDGELVVTNLRLAFVGEEQHDWWCALLEEVRHEGEDRSLLKRWNHDEWAAFGYDDAEVTRLYIDLAVAEQHGTKDAYRAKVTELLREHELRRPAPPELVAADR